MNSKSRAASTCCAAFVTHAMYYMEKSCIIPVRPSRGLDAILNSRVVNYQLMQEKTWLEQAEMFVSYYQPLAADQGSVWLLGLFMAKQWLRFLQQPEPNLNELHLFVEVLEAERYTQGSGWSDMCFRVKKWVGEIESRE